MPRANLRDCELHYEEYGKGTPLLLVPGFAGTGNYWESRIAAFSSHFWVIIHDHRGTGQSTRSNITYSGVADDRARRTCMLADCANRIQRGHSVILPLQAA